MLMCKSVTLLVKQKNHKNIFKITKFYLAIYHK